MLRKFVSILRDALALVFATDVVHLIQELNWMGHRNLMFANL